MEEYLDVLDENGDFTGQTATRAVCHRDGLWHRGVVVHVVSPDNNRILLQKRSDTKRLWPGLWDLAAGGHVDAGEFSYQAALREAEEELGLKYDSSELVFIGSTRSQQDINDIRNRHFNDYFVLYKDFDPKTLTLDPAEVTEIKWFSYPEFKAKVDHNYQDLTDKIACWDYLIRFLESQKH